MNILVIDDNLMTSVRIESQLTALGHTVKVARKAPEGANFDLVLLNLGSRTLSGAALVSSARENLPPAQIWGFCGHVEVEIRRAAKAAGIDRLLTNEVAITDLASVIAAA
jgi:CheY-like chemotaxis protein